MARYFRYLYPHPMKRDLLLTTTMLWGVALLCLALLDWVDYQGFLLSLLFR